MVQKPDFIRFFRLGFRDLLEKKKLTRQVICNRAGLTNQFVGAVLLGNRDGSEVSRRALAAAIETPYEDIIRHGERIEIRATSKAANQ